LYDHKKKIKGKKVPGRKLHFCFFLGLISNLIVFKKLKFLKYSQMQVNFIVAYNAN
jgi:hypothetical protein